MAAGDKLLAGIESNKLFLKKHLSRKRAMKISYGIATLIYLIVTTLLLVLTIQAYNLYDIKDVISNDGGIQAATNISLATIKSELGIDVENKVLLLGFTVGFFVFFATSLGFYISLSQMKYTARPKLWISTSIILLPLVIPFIICIIVFIKYIKDKHWKESRKDITQTIQPILSSVIKEFEEDVLQKEVNVKRISNEHPGFEHIYNDIKIDTKDVVKIDTKDVVSVDNKKEVEKPKKLSKKEKRALKKLEKNKSSNPKVDESQITDEVESEVEESPIETPTET